MSFFTDNRSVVSRLLPSLFAILLLVGCGGTPVVKTSDSVPLKVPEAQAVGSLALGPFVTNIDPNESSVGIQYTWWKNDVSLPRLPPDARLLSDGDLRRGFASVFSPLGYKMAPEETSVFKSSALPDLLLGGRLSRVNANAWHPFAHSPDLRTGAPGLVKGGALLEITWELLEISSKKVIYTRKIPGRFEVDGDLPGGVSTLILNAYVDSLKGLAADPAFRDAVLNAKPVDKRRDAAGQSS
ncbi:hypothetical protein [Hydrogenophaga pseudoflava]|uniref:hypothetical protein n=1 Tax=Hydrogenophaga pseudoflava TaxID=47421 RepID=UPI0027E4A36C|nr:hypothetical protein [Hydrogenophaga pseudoflava]MDQ7743557.1 hypothetical protein [Hydrogenophaga pseudoflava]